jgi:hypothetical protein
MMLRRVTMSEQGEVLKARTKQFALDVSLSGILCVGHNMRSVHAPETEIIHV